MWNLNDISWEDTFKWLSSVKSDKYVAYCKAYKKSFHIDQKGIWQIKSHTEGDGHTANIKKLKIKEHCQHPIMLYPLIK